jgi:hypothetical protein
MHRIHVAHCEQHQFGPDLELAAGDIDQLAILPVDAACDQRLDLAALALEGLRLYRPVALTTFLL